MEETTAFIKLAERIGENIHSQFRFCCTDLPRKESDFFTVWFKPTEKEIETYNHLYGPWMGTADSNSKQDNNLRILALLFAEQLWLDNQQLTPCS